MHSHHEMKERKIPFPVEEPFPERLPTLYHLSVKYCAHGEILSRSSQEHLIKKFEQMLMMFTGALNRPPIQLFFHGLLLCALHLMR